MSFQKRSLSMNYIVGFLSGILAGLTATVALAGLLAILIVSGSLPIEMLAYGSVGIIAVSGTAAALVAGLIIRKGWLPVCVGAGGMYFICLFSMGVAFFGGVSQSLPLTVLLSMIGPCAIGILGIMGKRKPTFRHTKRRFR